jgi:hypothetical protein
MALLLEHNDLAVETFDLVPAAHRTPEGRYTDKDHCEQDTDNCEH